MDNLPKIPVGISRVLDTGFSLYRQTFYSVVGYGFLIAACSNIDLLLQLLKGPVAAVQPTSITDFIKDKTIADYSYLIIGSLLALMPLALLIIKIDTYVKVGSATIDIETTFTKTNIMRLVFALFYYILFTLITTILFIIPGIYWWVKGSLFSFCILLEKKKTFAAIKRSWQLTQQNWWRTFTVISFAPTILFIAIAVEGMILEIFFNLLTLDTAVKLYLFKLFATLTLIILEGCFAAVEVCILLILYYDLVLRKTRPDIAARLKAWET